MSDENKEQLENKEDVVELDNEITTENDGIKISDDVVAVIAGVAVSEVPGVAEMSGGFAGGITEVLSGRKNLAKGIKVETKEDVPVAIQAALECKQPALIEVVIHEDDKVFPMVSPGAPISDVFDADDLAENK